MKLSGSYQIKLEKQKVWEALNNPEILKQAIPGCEEFIKKSDTEFTATAKNKIGPFNASFTGDIELKDIDAPNSYKITGSGNSPVGFASGEANVKLEEKEGTTELIYSVEANVGGKIAQVGSRLIDMTAKKMADVFFGKFSEIISSTNAEDEKMIFEELNISTNEKILNKNNNKKKYLYFSFAVLIVLIIYIFYNNF